MDELMGFFLERPQRLISMGRGLVGCCAIAICAGMVGLVVRTGAAFAHGFGAASAQSSLSLADLYPNLWSWWVPESLWGAVPYLITASFGVHLVLLGRKIVRIYH